ncbi:hypothetical protein [Acidithiobacillus thiooxidans]|uniref:Uncharacterized protein n=1 Tax=Acidithiobacillus thiooxidans TaxID=930 RepID=A0A1C2J1Z2_ACITH|nr:hypothetical protein [Acidithiobacillus thiooxidans]OCX68841.1 hypothetical protein A6M23_17130 [Acidithiobacillus thiooxidans]OCX82271.1 hypothetical protein A6P08_12525 [Acidithiobacillus thiooxidans]
MRKSRNQKIEAYVDAAVRVAKIRVHARIAGVSPDDYLDSRHDDSLEIIERLARYYWRRDMANELNMPNRLAIAFEKHRRSITDPEQLIKKLEKQVGSCGHYCQLPRPEGRSLQGSTQARLTRESGNQPATFVTGRQDPLRDASLVPDTGRKQIHAGER